MSLSIASQFFSRSFKMRVPRSCRRIDPPPTSHRILRRMYNFGRTIVNDYSSSYPLVSSLPSSLSVMYQTARIFFGNERNSYVTLSIVLIRKREKRYLRKTFSYFPPFPSPIPPSVEGAPDSVSRNPHGLETRSPGFFAANRTISQLDRNA